MSIEPNFPAFPSGLRVEDDSGRGYHFEQAAWLGMSLRDWFAGQALAGLLASPSQIICEGVRVERNPELMAGAAYQQADAMMKARTQ